VRNQLSSLANLERNLAMAGLGSIGSTPNLFASLRSSSAESSAETLTTEPEPTREAGMAARIDQALASAGVDEETAEALKADLTAAFEESRASGTTPPAPEAMKSTVDAIFAEYGLDANDILGPPPGRGAHGAGGTRSPGDRQPNAGEETAEPRQTLLELLNQMSNEGASSEELSQLLIDALNGLDQTA
jgi:hypothetical protein